MAAIDVKTNLIIEQILLDQKAKAQLQDMYHKSLADTKTPNSPEARKIFDAAAKRHGVEEDRAEKVQPGMIDKLMMVNPLTFALNGLKKAIDVGIQNSKIVQTFQKKVAEALGLLVDLILMPFLPLLIGALIALFEAVMWFGEVWAKYADPIAQWIEKYFGGKDESGKPGTTGLTTTEAIIHFFVTGVMTDLSEMWQNLLKFVFGNEKERGQAILNFLTGLKFNVGSWLPVLIAEKIFTLFFGSPDKKEEAWADIWLGIRNNPAFALFEEIALPFLRWFLGTTGETDRGKELSMYFNLTNPVGWFLNILEYLFTGKSEGLSKQFDILVNLKQNGGGFLWDLVTGAMNLAGVKQNSTAKNPISSARSVSIGGMNLPMPYVSQPSASAPQINTTITGNVYGVDDLRKKMEAMARVANNAMHIAGMF